MMSDADGVRLENDFGQPLFLRSRLGLPARKRYYSPSEIRRRKGCIGCGGAVLILPVLVGLLGLAIAVF